MLVQLKNVFTMKILPEVLTRSMIPNYDNPNRKYCVCGRPSFEPMIALTVVNASLNGFVLVVYKY